MHILYSQCRSTGHLIVEKKQVLNQPAEPVAKFQEMFGFKYVLWGLFPTEPTDQV